MRADVQAEVRPTQRTAVHEAVLSIAVHLFTLKAALGLPRTKARVKRQNLSPHFLHLLSTPIIAHAVKGTGCGPALRRALDWCAL